MRNTTGGDPRDRRQMYLGDDHLNPDMRPSVTRLVNKLNSMTVMEDPENRASVIRKLSVDLPPYEVAEVLAWMANSWAYAIKRIPFHKPSILSGSSFETVYMLRFEELRHDFEPLPSRKKPGKLLNKCLVCSEKKDFWYHSYD